MTDAQPNDHFVALLMQLHYTAWVQLGKVANPGSGKVERDLEAAKSTIDVLGMLEEKTQGNLHADELKLLTRMLLDLRMNYVEEAKQGTTSEGAETKSSAPTDPTASSDAAQAAEGEASGGSEARSNPSSAPDSQRSGESGQK